MESTVNKGKVVILQLVPDEVEYFTGQYLGCNAMASDIYTLLSKNPLIELHKNTRIVPAGLLDRS